MGSFLNLASCINRSEAQKQEEDGGDKTVKEVLRQELIKLHQSMLFEDAIQFGRNVGEVSKNKRLLYLFQKDLMPGLAGEILDGANRRDGKIEDDGRSLKTVSKTMKTLGWLVLGLVDVGMLFYVFLFAASQDNHRQTAWGQSFAVWMILEVVLVSTSTVILMHIFLPALIMRDVSKVTEKLMDSIANYYERIEAGSDLKDEADDMEGLHQPLDKKKGQGKKEEKYQLKVEGNEMNPLNAASYLFLSYRLAERYSDLKISKIILAFQTPWPRQSYQHVHDVKSEYTDSWTAVTRSFSVIIVFFLSNLLAVPLAVQDMIVQLVSTVTMGYTILLHVQLYDIFPALVIIPTMFVLGVGYYVMKSHERAEQSEKEKIRDRLVSRRSMKEKKKQEGEGEGEGKEDCEVFNKYKDVMSSDNDVRELRSSGEEDVRVAEAVKHVSRRQSVQQAVIQLKRMEVEMEAIEEQSLPLNEEELDDKNDGRSLTNNTAEVLPLDYPNDGSPLDEEEPKRKKDCKDNAQSDEYTLSDIDLSNEEDCIAENLSVSDSTSLLDSFQDLLYE